MKPASNNYLCRGKLLRDQYYTIRISRQKQAALFITNYSMVCTYEVSEHTTGKKQCVLFKTTYVQYWFRYYLLSQICFCSFLHFTKNHGRDFLWGKQLFSLRCGNFNVRFTVLFLHLQNNRQLIMKLTLTAEQMPVLGLLQNPVMGTILPTRTLYCRHAIQCFYFPPSFTCSVQGIGYRFWLCVHVCVQVCNCETVRATVRGSTGSQGSIRP